MPIEILFDYPQCGGLGRMMKSNIHYIRPNASLKRAAFAKESMDSNQAPFSKLAGEFRALKMRFWHFSDDDEAAIMAEMMG
ncbi:hypothetical protein TcWFU_004890 [Taenia crassiceps]|uniref:Uncharacterized protein n=1 Tax=Taenia crassiceps TaxID=6207 RepID=A0ABR4QLP6_9CEST